MTAQDIPISLYIHMPWCVHKCPYCDFNSHQKQGPLPETNYINALLADFKTQSPSLQGRPIHTLFIGGGTPSLFSPESYYYLLTELALLADISPNTEITLEANPGAMEQAHYQGYHDTGINRLSLGVQSFQDKQLKKLERIHSADDAINAFNQAKSAGFKNINIDLMFGLPNQTTDDGLYDLQTAIGLDPSHLSWYQLTIEPHTAFYQRPPLLPSEDTLWTLQQQGQALMKNNGYLQYEVSAYSRLTQQCQHNRNYWLYGDYIGIGAGAHSKITEFNTQTLYRRWNVKHPKDYLNIQTPYRKDQQIIVPKDRPLEFMMNALRLYESIPFSLFEKRTGLSRHSLNVPLQTAKANGLLDWDLHTLQLTQTGRRYLNDLIAMF